MGGASTLTVVANHDDPECCGGEEEPALRPLTRKDHGGEQHETEHRRDD
jgi:hypothetical protein